MSKLQDLINWISNEKVPYTKLQDIAEIGTGTGNRVDSIENGIYPFYVRSKDVLKSNKYLFDEKAIIIPGEGGVGEIFHYVEGKYNLHQRAYRVHPVSLDVVPKFVYYYLTSAFKKYIMKYAVNATVTSIRLPMLQNIKIPVPPLQIQEEIVRILDLMSEVSIKLTSEYILRSKQYQYYLDSLFSIEKTINISKICQFKRGKGLQKSDFDINGKLGCIHYGQIYTKYGLSTKETISRIAEETSLKCTPVEPNNIVIACTSENVEDICKAVVWEGSSRIFTGGHSIVCSTSYEPRYVAYFLKSTMFQKQKRKLVYGTKVIEIKTSSLEKIQIPDVSKEEQRKVVDLLDKFDSYVNDLFFGIPAEIEARKKQYEFYRDKLLTFKEVKN